MTNPPINPPVADRKPLERVHHGDVVIDDYEWLREKTNPEVIAYLEAENAYTEAQTAHLAGLRDEIFEEIKSRTQQTDMSVPVRDGDWWYYGRTVEGEQYALQCRCPALVGDWTPPELTPGVATAGEQVLLDGNLEAQGHEFFALGSFSVSDDGNLLAYAVDNEGDERYTLRVKDLRTGEMLADEVTDTFPGAMWSHDGQYIFYPTVDESWRPDTIWRHRLGTVKAQDVAIFTEPDDRYWVGIGTTRSRKYLVIEVGSKITTESRVLDAANPTGEFTVVLPRREGVEYMLEHAVVAGQDRFLILHNDGAENFELVEAPVTDPTDQRVLIAHRDDVRLEDVEAFASNLVLSYRRGAVTRLAVWPLAAAGSAGADEHGYGELREIEFAEALYSVGSGSNPNWDAPTLRLGYGSFVTPSCVFDYEFATGALHLRKQQLVLGDFDPGDYEQVRDWAVAEDGVRVPLSVIRRKGVQTPAPTLLYGYGSYEASMDPSFSIARLSLLDRGVVFVVAHVRGGGEMGRGWYEDGKMLAKRNTFTDFIAAGKHLVEAGVTTPAQMVAEGGSAGGLLMGAVANMAPELFGGILAVVPFVDPLTSILDPSLPLTVIEWDEWGDPLHNADVYEYMKSYSPYENVEAKEYPPILAITSLNDTRVLYVEPAKWVAKLRATKTGDAPLLLQTEMSAGHGGVSGRYDKWKQTAFEYAWVAATTGAVETG